MTTISNKLKLQEYFFRHPTTSLRVREIEREAKLPLPSVTKYVKELVLEGILQEKKIGSTVFFTANRAGTEYQRRKLLHNLRIIYDAELIEHIKENLHNPPIRLFGSFSRGEDTEESDIDLYIQTSLRHLSLERFEKKLQRKIHVFTYKNIHDIENKELANNIMNGIPLNGYIESFT